MIKFCVLGSGSEGNATYLNINEHELLFDAGFSYKELKLRLENVNQDISKIKSIFISHQHSDHTQAIPQFQKKQKVTIYSNIKKPITIDNDIKVIPFHLSHDENCTGFRLEYQGFSFVYVPDTGCIPELAMKHLFNATVIAIEFNYDIATLTENQVYPTELIERIASDEGHMDNVDSGRVLSYIEHPGLNLVVPIHISKNNNNYGLVEYEAKKNVKCRVVPARQELPTEMFYFM